jgi:hypothetical protein
VWWRGGYGRIIGGLRVLELAAESLEASLVYVDHHVDTEPAERGQHDISLEEDCRVGRSGEVWRRGVPENQPPPENPVRSA